jgi:death-on-curing protein
VTGQIRFLSVDEVVQLHEDQIRPYGGASGLRDISLLESAVAQPAATFEGRDLHPDLIDKAAAYAFHLCCDHPFVDGNKRVALASALVFLDLNGVEVTDRRGGALPSDGRSSVGPGGEARNRGGLPTPSDLSSSREPPLRVPFAT